MLCFRHGCQQGQAGTALVLFVGQSRGQSRDGWVATLTRELLRPPVPVATRPSGLWPRLYRLTSARGEAAGGGLAGWGRTRGSPHGAWSAAGEGPAGVVCLRLFVEGFWEADFCQIRRTSALPGGAQAQARPGHSGLPGARASALGGCISGGDRKLTFAHSSSSSGHILGGYCRWSPRAQVCLARYLGLMGLGGGAVTHGTAGDAPESTGSAGQQ